MWTKLERSDKYPDWVSIAIATLDTIYQLEEIEDIYTDSKPCWLETKSSKT